MSSPGQTGRTSRTRRTPNAQGLTPLVRRQALEGYLFAAPWLAGFFVLTAGSMLFAAWMSLQRWDIVNPPEFVGFRNYSYAFSSDPLFWKSLANTLYYALGSVPIRIAVALALAVLLNQRVKGLAIFRTIFYLPSVVTGVATAMLWMMLLNPDVGGINYVLRQTGVENPPRWLGSEQWAIPGLILMSAWSVGAMMIIFLAGLQNIPDELQDAARVDGAAAWQRFCSITIPLLTPTILFNLVISVIAGFQVFMQAYVMTNGLASPNNATLTFVFHLYRNAFEYFRMGYASALAWILFLIILALTLIILRSSRSWVHYEGEKA